MRPIHILIVFFILSAEFAGYAQQTVQSADTVRLRVVISSDFPPTNVCMSGCAADHCSDPDDVQSMVRFLLYTNEFDVEGLIASSGTFANIAKKQNILDILNLYDEVDENLRRHDSRFPSADYLRSVTYQGRSGTWGGSVSNNIGGGKDSEASDSIISLVDRPDPRPIWFCFWGDCSNLAQAIWKVQNTRSTEDLKTFLGKIRVYQIAHQDSTIDWLLNNFPDLFIIYSKDTYQGIFGGPGDALGDLTWLDTNIRRNHGPLGAIYPPAAMGVDGLKEGDSPSFMYLVSAAHGMNNPENPGQESWGGQYIRSGTTSHWIDGPGTISISKWKSQYQAEFAQRADWMTRTDSRSVSFKTYMNPVIPGDHADCSLTRIGKDFYTTGSSYNPTPLIYHSTDLVHWEAIAQPVSAAWSGYDDKPGGGCVGGALVYYGNKYWDFFSSAFSMYYVTAEKPEGPWSLPTLMKCPSGLPGLGWDNSIFIDSDSSWYLLVKNGQANNWIVQLGKDGQPSGSIFNLTWLNPAPGYPYDWAEGPVMWKYGGYYYYSFAINVAGGQKVMRSKTLTDDPASWQMPVDLFNENDPRKSGSLFIDPNHSSSVISSDDKTFWVAHPVYTKASEWKGQGRQGLLNEVHYNTNDEPLADYPVNLPLTAPILPGSGIPWMVPKSDFFTPGRLSPEWSFLGYTPSNSYSLSDRPGWLRLSPKSISKANTVIKNDGEHNYSLITKVDFTAKSVNDEAGIQIIRGDETKFVKLAGSLNADGKRIIVFSFESIRYEVLSTSSDTVWLKMIRINHKISGYYSHNARDWIKIGQDIDISIIDSYTDPGFHIWEGTRQGLFVAGNSPAFFDLYIYRDAYTPILASCPANQSGTSPLNSILLDNIHNLDWVLYAGVEFGNPEYDKVADSIQITASGLLDGQVEIWLDSIGTGNKIGNCNIKATGSWNSFKTFSGKIGPATGRHDLYLRFTSSTASKLFQIKWIQFIPVTAHVINARTNLSGDTILLQFDKKMKSPASCLSGFLFYMNSGDSLSINSISLQNSDSTVILVAINPRIYFEDSITFTYSGSFVKSNEGYDLHSYSFSPVKNYSSGYPPSVTSAIVQLNESYGSAVTLKFDRPLADVSTQKVFFTIKVNGKPYTIDTLSGNSDSINFVIASSLNYADTIKISYSGGTVVSLHNGMLADFTDFPVQNMISQPSGMKDIRKNNQVLIYPVPVKSEMNVKSEIEFNKIRIFNPEEKLEMEKRYNENIKTAAIHLNLNKGFYIIELSNEYSSTYSKILIE
jgi:xylan 1,4-beta-xylosidase